MAEHNPLNALFFRYRKRKQLSVDGRTPGLEYQARHRGLTQAPSTGHVAQANHDRDYLGGQDGVEYDPGRSFYPSAGPAYRAAAPWHNMQVEPTPSLRMPLPHFEEGLEHLPENGLSPKDEIEAAIDMIKNQAVGSIPLPEQTMSLSPLEAAFGVEGDQNFVSEEEADMVVAAQEIEQAMEEAMTHFEPMGGNQPTLEDLVEQEWQQTDAFAMQDPMQMDPFDQFPPGHPGMPMDPFGLMGPGF